MGQGVLNSMPLVSVYHQLLSCLIDGGVGTSLIPLTLSGDRCLTLCNKQWPRNVTVVLQNCSFCLDDLHLFSTTYVIRDRESSWPCSTEQRESSLPCSTEGQ